MQSQSDTTSTAPARRHPQRRFASATAGTQKRGATWPSGYRNSGTHPTPPNAPAQCGAPRHSSTMRSARARSRRRARHNLRRAALWSTRTTLLACPPACGPLGVTPCGVQETGQAPPRRRQRPHQVPAINRDPCCMVALPPHPGQREPLNRSHGPPDAPCATQQYVEDRLRHPLRLGRRLECIRGARPSAAGSAAGPACLMPEPRPTVGDQSLPS